jgi:uncharacterized protein (TIGR03086 family)
MDERQVFVLADEALVRVVEQIADDQWGMMLPDWFPRGSTQKDVTLRQIIDYHAYDDAWVPDMAAGTTMDEAGKKQFDGDLLGEDPKHAFARIAERASLAVLAIDDLDRVVHTSFGDYPAREYLWQVTSFRGLRAHDIAKLIGVGTTLPDDLVEGLWQEVAPHAEEWRAIGVYGPAIEVPKDADLQDRLLGLTGRDPDHEYPR